VHELCTLLELPTPDPAREDNRRHCRFVMSTENDFAVIAKAIKPL